MPSYDSTLAASLQSLATSAISALNPIEVLPPPWSLINLITGTTGQGFFAVGQSGTTTQLVLALGAQWSDWIVAQGFSPALIPTPLPSYFFTGGGEAGSSTFDLTVLSLYSAMRPTLLAQLATAVNQIPIVSQAQLLVTGQGIGAALAQLAAFDLRAQNQGQTYPFAAIRCYTFSAPPLANSAFQSQFNAAIPDAWTVTAAGSSVVDFFPSQPSSLSGFVPLGTATSLSASIPSVEAPWWERSGAFYGAAYAASSSSAAVAARARSSRRSRIRTPPAGRVALATASPPAGYSADTAYAMALLTATVNQLAEHPTRPLNIPQPWVLSSVLGDSAPWGAVFTSVFPAAIAVVFRAGISYAEAASGLCLIGPFGPSWLPSGAAMHQGAVQIYGDVRDTLRTQLSALGLSGKTLYVTGHSLGGLAALVAATDLVCNPISSGAPVPYTYSLGAPTSVGYAFQSAVCPSSGSCTLQAQTYLVARDRDTIVPVNWSQLLTTFGNPVVLSGLTSTDDEAFHSLSSYATLLNPGSGS